MTQNVLKVSPSGKKLFLTAREGKFTDYSREDTTKIYKGIENLRMFLPGYV